MVSAVGSVALVSGCLSARVRYEMSSCEGGNPKGCEDAAVSFAERGSPEAESFTTRFRTLELVQCARGEGEPRVRVVCALRLLWWSEDPEIQARGLAELGSLCANPPPDFSVRLSMNGDNDRMATPQACLFLGDAYLLGRGVKAELEAAHAIHARGCASGPDNDNAYSNRQRLLRNGTVVSGPRLFSEVARAETPHEYAERNSEEVYNHPVELNAVEANCRRLSRPSALFEEPAYAAVRLVLPNGATRLAQARARISSGELEQAIWLLSSVAGSKRPDDPRDEARTLLEPLAAKQSADRWSAAVQPHVQVFHFLRALDAAKRLAQSKPVNETFQTRLAALSKDAVAHHLAEAPKSGPLVAAVHRALAHQIDGTLSRPVLPAAKAQVSGPPPLALSALPADCAWLAALLPRALETAREGVAVQMSLNCTHAVTLQAPTEVRHPYTETAYRKEIGEVEGPIVTEKEDYKCIQATRVPDGRGGSSTIQVWATCTRDRYKRTRIPGEVSVAYQVQKTRIETRQTRMLAAEVSGTLQVGDRAPIPFRAKKVLQETSSKTPGAPEVPFTSATLETVDVQAANQLVASIREELAQMDRARELALAQEHERSVVQSIARLIDQPSAERDEAFLAGLLLQKAPPAAAKWLDERFGISPTELRQMVNAP